MDAAKYTVQHFSTEEIIASVVSLLKGGRKTMTRGIMEQNIGYAGMASADYYQAEKILEALDQKLNGKKEATVVQ